MRRRALMALLIVGALVAVIVVTLLVGGKSAAPKPAPALPAQVLVGPRLTLAQLRGKPAIIHFWASWCGPCRKEAPQLEHLASELHGRATLVGVAWSDSRGSARTFVRAHHWTFPVLEDDSGVVGNRYGLTGLPATFLLDARGRIVKRLVGGQTATGLLAALHE